MEGQRKKSFFLVFCVLVLYHDMCTCALTVYNKKHKSFGGKRRNFGPKSGKYRGRNFQNPEHPERDFDNVGHPGRNFKKPGHPGRFFEKPRIKFPPAVGPSDRGLRPPFLHRGPLNARAFLNVLRNNERSHFERFINRIESRDYKSPRDFTKILVEHEKLTNVAFLEDLKEEGFNVSNSKEICADWEEFDGTTCVCSDRCEANSEINMGIVCDTSGKKYRNLCRFTYKMCSEQILCSAQLTTCGVCNSLKLTGSHYYPEDGDHGLGIFMRDTTGNTWTAEDDHGNKLKLFYSEDAKTWVVGSVDKTQAGIVFTNYTDYPQDIKGGAVITINETYSQLDPFLHFECIADSIASRITRRQHSRQKRFGFLIAMLVISIAATVAQVTVTAVQKKKGCLFYPDVCKMKKEIKDTLRPEVESLKRTFNSIIGEPSGFRDMVHNFFQSLLDLKGKMAELRKLEQAFQDLSEKIGPDLKYLSPQIAEDFDISFYDQWLKALGQQTAWGIIGLVYVQMPLEMVSLLASTASKASMAFAAFGAVISVAAAVVSIVVSWKNEKAQRDQLRKVKRNLIDARQRLKSAISHAKGFQVKFYKTVIYPLKKFTHHMRNYDSHFQNFYNHLVRVFGSSMSENVDTATYAKVTSTTIKALKDQQLTPLMSFLSLKLNDLKKKIEAYKQNEKLITLIRNNVNEKLYPTEIYTLIKRVDAKLATKLVPTEFSLFKFIAEKVMSNKNCYWGYKLNGVRQGSITSSNYRTVPLCNSPELYTIESSLQQLTTQNMSPDRIVARTQHDRFINKYQKLKYLADFILTAKPCYWGYSLTLIRSDSISVSELNNANPSKAAFSSVKILPENLQGTALCSAVKICNSKWQTYAKCLLKGFDGGSMCASAGSC